MSIKIQRIDKDLPLPQYSTTGSVGFDFVAREETVIAPKQIALIPSNNIIEVPQGFALFVVPRSSMPRKTGLVFPHSVGIIDQDYSGPEDEIKIQVFNNTDQEVTVKKGERVAQGIFVKVEVEDWEEVAEISQISRGGFGSTDIKGKDG
ncbi:dUTP diphosphatase [Patescibacteria group bacterium]|nr:dUTP diphosphatase [Patescibacteria group bacterium]MCL5409475.1 dUTP diphosphatase [Patescibacteria group bacterium]